MNLRPMTDREFAAYMSRMMPTYAAEGARATGMSSEEALAFAQRQLAALLPDGVRTSGHDFLVVEASPGEGVGVLWAAVQGDGDARHLFLYDIAIDEEQRGHGYGSDALEALAETARVRGLGRIVLHVFEHNAGAIRLYERLGYQTVSQRDGSRHMTLDLGEGPAGQ